MDTNKIAKKIAKKIEQKLDQAWDNGFEAGTDYTVEQYQSGFTDGANAERERIKTIFDMNIQWALESNKGSDVVFFTKAKQIIEPIEVDYSEEAYQRSLEQDGF